MRAIRDTRVCVAGGAGFLGSHLVQHLIEDRGCAVLVIDNLSSGYREFIPRDAVFEHCDITASESHLLNLLRAYKIEYVFNYAAEPYIPVSFARPLHVFNINAFGALKLMNAAQEAGVQGILQVSSAEIYGASPGNINESAPVVPHSTYGAAKAAIDAIVQVRWREARTPVIALRQFNCIGERDVTHPYVVPEIIRQLARQRGKTKCPGISLGNNSTRDFLYAGDQARMACALLERGEFGEVYNLGSEESIAIYRLADTIAMLMGFDVLYVSPDESRKRPWEIWSLRSDNAKIYGVIDERPKLVLEQALSRTIAYLVDNLHLLRW